MAELSVRAWDYLQRHHRGAAHAIPQAELAATLACNSRALQAAFIVLLETDRKLVCSSCRYPFGAFIPETQDEKDAYVEQLRGRLIGNARRIKLVRRSPIFPPPEPRQRELYFATEITEDTENERGRA